MDRDYTDEYTQECYNNYYSKHVDREDYYAHKEDERYLDSIEEEN